jgi:phage terminase small subunit
MFANVCLMRTQHSSLQQRPSQSINVRCSSLLFLVVLLQWRSAPQKLALLSESGVKHEPSPAEAQMPILRNPKHETFCRALASGKNATDAYAEAGYAANRACASRLRTNAEIVARVRELMEKQETKAIVTSAWLQDELRSIAEEARKADYGSAGLNVARNALMDIARLRGDIIERKEIKNVDEFEDMDVRKLWAWIENKRHELGLTGREQ